MKWWAYIPQGDLACDSGCPLYIWLDGSFDSNTHQRRDDIMQYEMLQRGFVAVTVGYDDSLFRPSMGCDSTSGFLGSQGLLDKTKAIFDEDNNDSAVSQLCNLDEVDCDLGIATHGFSQGAQLASLGKLLCCSTHLHAHMHILNDYTAYLLQVVTLTLEFLPVSCMVMVTLHQLMVTFHVLTMYFYLVSAEGQLQVITTLYLEEVRW